LPPTAACIGCHNAVLLRSEPFAAVRASQSTERPIAWRRVNALPDFVFFDHSIHVAKGVGCETCHGRVDQMAEARQAMPMTMGWCVSCHRNPTPYLRPAAEITTMGWDAQHDASTPDSLHERLAHENSVRRLTSCTTCHR
jgi:GTP cyclohydrolase III